MGFGWRMTEHHPRAYGEIPYMLKGYTQRVVYLASDIGEGELAPSGCHPGRFRTRCLASQSGLFGIQNSEFSLLSEIIAPDTTGMQI